MSVFVSNPYRLTFGTTLVGLCLAISTMNDGFGLFDRFFPPLSNAPKVSSVTAEAKHLVANRTLVARLGSGKSAELANAKQLFFHQNYIGFFSESGRLQAHMGLGNSVLVSYTGKSENDTRLLCKNINLIGGDCFLRRL